MQFDYATLEGTATWAGVMAGPGPVAHSTDWQILHGWRKRRPFTAWRNAGDIRCGTNLSLSRFAKNKTKLENVSKPMQVCAIPILCFFVCIIAYVLCTSLDYWRWMNEWAEELGKFSHTSYQWWFNYSLFGNPCFIIHGPHPLAISCLCLYIWLHLF